MGLSMITALEIFTNPYDLHITIGQQAKGGKFAFGIFRGPGHSFKPMHTSVPFVDILEDAIRAVEGVLQVAQVAITREFAERASLPSQYLNPDGLEIDQSKVLNPKLIDRILEELRRHQVANTFEMIDLPG